MDADVTRLRVLDALQDDIEELATLRPLLQSEVSDDEIIAALRSLLRDRLIHAWDYAPDGLELVPVYEPRTDDASLRRYWYKPSPEGNRLWREWGKTRRDVG